MSIRILMFLGLVLFNGSTYADTSYWDEQMVPPYVHYSELQRRWAMAFMAPHLKELKGDEKILDMGCGDGKITADISRFIPEGTITGIDLSPFMIGWAKKQFHPLEYPNASFREGNFLDPIEGTYDRIVSFCVLHHCSDKQGALCNVKSALKPEGKILFLIPYLNNPAFNEACSHVIQQPEWSGFYKDFARRVYHHPEEYRLMLEKCGYEVIKIEAVETMDPFVNSEEFKAWMAGTLNPVVPSDKRKEFNTQILNEYIRLDPSALSPDGVVYVKFGYICIEAKDAQP